MIVAFDWLALLAITSMFRHGRMNPLARRLGAAPSKRSFGDSVAHAGARRTIKLVRLLGIAHGHARWQGAILLLNHNREIERAGTWGSLVAVRKDLPNRNTGAPP